MIRRNPTLIPMSDLDVQDIRDMIEIEQQQAEAESSIQQKEQAADEMSDAARAAHAKQERARRLGLQTGTTN
ncbi:hypothetical protein BDN72DRAFT_834246 [Pluteus cervinus]|uniref:Uncharacterized protein n=1 Tax=Pluteus cervinus TaxID=181527 RepID=A0ACD3B756_9AGAR|nr:hypothetical protein BDN72DRAFT_834246 [Pluteus cervinus]